MPFLQLKDSDIHYEVHGEGYPIFLFAPGFLSSRIERWRTNPANPGQPQDFLDPIAAMSSRFKMIAHDVRNAGESRGTARSSDGWHSYVEDALALLDHLEVTRCHVMGACIGVTFALALAQARPGLATALVLQNPIGLGRNGRNRDLVNEEINLWIERVRGYPRIDRSQLPEFTRQMFAGDFLFGVPREYLASYKLPMLLMPGDDNMHPVEVSYEVAQLAPHTEVVAPWKGDKFKHEAIEFTRDFFIRNTPKKLDLPFAP